jgi:hypothetical protein
MTKWLEKAMGDEEQGKGWRIHESRHQAGGEAVVQYLGQRLHGSVVSADEVTEVDDTVAISGRNGSIEMASSLFAFRYLNHIPQRAQSWFVTAVCIRTDKRNDTKWLVCTSIRERRKLPQIGKSDVPAVKAY